MSKYLTRILICTVPVLIGVAVNAWAVDKYWHGEGGFRLGVDLVGGTILVYEVDTTKMQGGLSSYRPDEMITALKRRIDPNDLYNIVIRPLGGDPPRIEVILPTGGRHQSKIEDDAWDVLLGKVKEKYPPTEGKDYNDYTDISTGREVELLERVKLFHPDVDMGRAKLFLQIAADDPQASVETLDARVTAQVESGTPYVRKTGGPRALTHEGIEQIKNLISQQGRLEFRILANTTDDGEAINLAREFFKPDAKAELDRRARNDEPPPSPRRADGQPFTVTLGGEPTRHEYSWVELGKEDLYSLHLNSDAENDDKYKAFWETVKKARDQQVVLDFHSGTLLYSRVIPPEVRSTLPAKDADKKYEYFMLTRDAELVRTPRGSWEPREITGKYLTGASSGHDEKGDLDVEFTFDAEGGNLFYDLTSRNKPSGEGESGFKRQLAILLDGQIKSTANLITPIRTSGRIVGNFTQADIDQLVRILRAGALPATLKRTPVSERTMSATLGEYTIKAGTESVLWAFAAILLFMAIYYRFAGLVACFALGANLILTVAFMVIVEAAFTLPGLAGLVLMLGMAVDANVLIYERLREERDRGANLAMALRNGYDRAFPTIIDTHLTSIFTAIVLYVVGNDQLKGFGISLTVGLIISLFTSLYVTRTIFDIWMGMGWLKKLTMMHIFPRRPNFDFMAIRNYFFAGTAIITIIGGGIFVWRLDKGGLNIDFDGGTSYTGRLERMVTVGELREYLLGGANPSKLPDLSINLLFTSDPDVSKGDQSKMFTITTSEKGHTDDILADINSRLTTDKDGKPLLTHVEFKVSPIDPEGPEGKRLAAENKRGAALNFFNPSDPSAPGFASESRVKALLSQEFEKLNLKNAPFRVEHLGVAKEERYSKMYVVADKQIGQADFDNALDKVRKAFESTSQPDGLEVFDGQLAKDTQQRALVAILASWIAILAYLWFRFGSWTFGAAAVVCLIHDLFFTLGGIAACHYLHGTFIGNILYLQDFKIDLPSVAALLTLVGYSVSDTIVVFDRIREVRGKNPALTPQMINDSVNQTLSRTLLSSLSVWLVVVVLYWFGGEGVHLFAFVMVIGVIVGTYSSIYIASPLLLIFGEGRLAKGRVVAVPQEVAPKD